MEVCRIKLPRILGYLAYSDKNYQNQPKNNKDIGSIFTKHTS